MFCALAGELPAVATMAVRADRMATAADITPAANAWSQSVRDSSCSMQHDRRWANVADSLAAGR
jgi:hypothetical protein